MTLVPSANDGGVAVTGCTGQGSGGNAKATWGTNAKAAGVRCLSATSTATNTEANVSITTSGTLQCSFT